MTMIVGTTHWKGICLNADTRVTKKGGTYEDNAQKITHINGGIGMAAAGDCSSAIMVKETLINNLEKIKLSGVKVKDEDMVDFMQDTIKLTLKDVRNHQAVQRRPIYDVSSVGLIGCNFPFLPLTLDYYEANNLIEVLVNTSTLNTIYSRYIKKIAWCANSKFNLIRIDEFHQSILFKYKLKLFDDEEACIYDVERVPFGKIVALGSGAKFDYLSKSPRALSWVLFSPEAENIEDASLHLTSMLAYADNEIGEDPRYGFKTFGGGVIAGVIRSHENGMGSTDIILGDLGSKADRKIVSRTYKKAGKLWVETKEGKNLELIPFPDCVNPKSLTL